MHGRARHVHAADVPAARRSGSATGGWARGEGETRRGRACAARRAGVGCGTAARAYKEEEVGELRELLDDDALEEEDEWGQPASDVERCADLVVAKSDIRNFGIEVDGSILVLRHTGRWAAD